MIFIRLKTHKYLFLCTLLYCKFFWQRVFVKKSNLSCFNIILKLATFVLTHYKNLNYTISIVHYIVLTPILHSNVFFSCYCESCFFFYLFFCV